jgi:hypothetical protein
MGSLFAICSTIVSVMDAGALLLSLFLDKRIYFQWSSFNARTDGLCVNIDARTRVNCTVMITVERASKV